jgi:hypothetical protein
VDDERYDRIFAALEYQEGHAIVWRDAINNYFLRLSGIPDEKGRAGHFPGRYEAETMKLDGYAAVDVTPWETAGGGRAVSCAGPGPCRASFVFDGASGTYDIRVRYFDLNTGGLVEGRRSLSDEGSKRPLLNLARRALGCVDERRPHHCGRDARRRRTRAARLRGGGGGIHGPIDLELSNPPHQPFHPRHHHEQHQR